MNKELIEKIMEEAEIKMYDNGASDASDMKSLEQILTNHLSDKILIDKGELEEMIEEASATKIILEGHGIPYANGYNDGYREGLKSLLDNK